MVGLTGVVDKLPTFFETDKSSATKSYHCDSFVNFKNPNEGISLMD